MTVNYFVSVFVARYSVAGPEFLQLLRAPMRLHRQAHLAEPVELPNFMANTWQLVTGKIEPDETAWRAALRELDEETGLHPIEFYQVDRVNTFYLAINDSLNHAPMFCAIVPPSAVVRLNSEHTAHRWLTVDAFADALMWPGERDAFAEVRQEILGDGPAKKFLKIELNA